MTDPGPLHRLLTPRSIAIIGISRPAPGKSRVGGGAVLANLRRGGFAGTVALVHPSADQIDGIDCVRSIDEAPGPIDVAVISLAATAVPDTIRACVTAGIRSFVVLSAGFSEAGTAEGRELEDELAELARGEGLAICGPNGLGMLNVVDGVYATNFAPIESITPRAGGLAIVSQSGAIAGSLLARANQRQIGISHVISTGNETATTMADYIDALVEDDRVRAISLYLEGANDPRALIAALTRATRAGKTVVVLKVGDSEVGARAALSHTAKLAGEPKLYRGAFEQAGVIQAESLPDVVDLQMYLMSERDPAQAVNGVCIVSISGGLGAVAADEFSRAGIAVPELNASVRAELGRLGIGATTNPVDTASATQRGDGVFTAALAAIGRDPQIDAIVVPLASRFPAAARATPDDLLHARDAAGLPVLAAWYAGEDNADAVAQLRASGRIACFDDAGACARAILAARHATPPAAPTAQAAQAAELTLDPALRGVLDEPTSKALLAARGVGFAAEAIADQDPDAIRKVADEIGYPVALKVVSEDIMHKAAVGGVRLGLGDGDAVAQAAREMLATVACEAPDAHVSGVLVSRMVDIVEEFIVGAYDDASFGATLAFGRGGSRVEQLDDVQLRLLPIGHAEIARLVDARLGATPAPGVREELIAQIESIATFAAAAGPRLRELDVNPLVVTGDGGVVALDAVIRLDDERQE